MRGLSKVQRSNTKKMIKHEDSEKFAKGANLFKLDNVHYLVDPMKSTTSIKVIKSHIARYGIPKLIISDNRPQYASAEFQAFCTEWGIEQRMSSQTYPKSNRKVEAAVKTIKTLLKNSKRRWYSSIQSTIRATKHTKVGHKQKSSRINFW